MLRDTSRLVHRENVGNVGTDLCLTSVDMTKPVPLLASLVSLFLMLIFKWRI